MNREQNHHMFYNGESVFRLGIVCFLLLKCDTCFNGSPTSTLFDNFPAPSIAEYLPVDIDFEPYHPVELTGEYNYGIKVHESKTLSVFFIYFKSFVKLDSSYYYYSCY